jgi:redox-sensitive bicupin YhaK (pirin superfamily)
MAVIAEFGGQEKDLGGGFRVRRLLPSLGRQSLGPFLFFDHFGPVTVEPGMDLDVRPHPHVGLATVTYLFEGAMMHRDSLGCVQRIEPGAINWMTAGRGIVHSERRPDDLAARSYGLHGLQLWAALPRSLEETDPSFAHTRAEDIPVFTTGTARGRVLVGSAYGCTSPVAAASPTLYVDLELDAGAQIVVPPLARELAVYPIDGAVRVDDRDIARQTMAVVDAERSFRLGAARTVRVVLIGGDPLDGRRHLYWNFVSTRKERILSAAADWEARRFPGIAGDDSFIPLPERRPTP